MPKRLLVLFVLILFLLAACSGAEQIAVTEAPASDGESAPTEAEPTAVKPTETSAPDEDKEVAVTGPEMECTLVSDQPDAPAELVAIFDVTDADWVKGVETAAVTIVEYSDFQ